MAKQDTSQLLRSYLEAIPDPEALRDMLDENVAFTLFAPNGKTNVGRDRILRGLAREFETFYRREAFTLEVLTVFGDDEFAAARFQITADTAMGPYRNNYSIIARFAAGRLVEAWEYTDTLSARDQLAPELSESS
jgi:ketosteroid isomerase-like protein